MDSNAAIAAASAVTNGVAGAAAGPISVQWALTIDVVLVVLLLAIRVGFFWFLADKLSRHTADLGIWKCILIPLVMAGLFAVLFTSMEPKVIGIALLVSLLVGCLLCKFLLWMDLERGVYACLLYLIVSGALGEFVPRWLDQLWPGRATINLALAHAVDNHARKSSGDLTLPPSASLHDALGRLSISTNESAFMSMVLSPMRAQQKLKAQIAGINKLATENASLVNELSGAGTNVSTRKQESAKLRESMNLKRKEGKGGDGPSLVPAGLRQAIDGIGAVAGDEAAVVDALAVDGGGNDGAPAEDAIPKGPEVNPLADAGTKPEPAPAQAPAPITASPAPDSKPETRNSTPDTHHSAVQLASVADVQLVVPPAGSAPKPPPPKPKAEPLPPELDPFAGLPAPERDAWNNSATGLVVTSIMRHHGGEVLAMVNGDMVHIGDTVSVASGGRFFLWRMVAITNYQSVWEPQFENKPAPSSTGIIYRF